ncbi:hypothetical protein [Desulfitobacterium sp.]|uniref:hypothetical protein n=1 Tax=Desulfitobacterium sp. TaxID=49981 RepID=UPI002B8A557C|nr:hypothetical protein [Desulfitobacterium sp.]HVJ48894.1 hypothetical protein [Desulfitobacterium sp.]
MREKGFATLLILLLFSAFATFGLEAYLKAQSENRMAKREALSRQAVYASEGGLEWAKSELIINPVFTGGKRTIGEGTVVIKVTVGEGGYWVTSDAQNGLVRRKIQVFLSPDSLDPGHWIMSQYQEIYQ